MRSTLVLVAALLAAPLLQGCSAARPETAEAATPRQGTGARPAGRSQEGGPRPYGDVVPGTAVSDSGLFVVHRVGDDVLFEIPDSLLGRDMLLVSRIARVPQMGGFIPAGYKAGEQVLRWERQGDRVLLRKQSFTQVAADSLPIAQSVVNNNFAPIVASFDVEAVTPGGDGVVVEVTDLFVTDVPTIGGLRSSQRREYGVRRLDPDRTFVNWVRSFPLNVDVRHTLTFDASSPPTDENTSTISMEMHQSMVLLPEEPMRPRYADDRVGFFGIERVNFGIDAQKAATQRFIRRWRLEPSDPAAYARGELVDPVKPIVYYLDPATPSEWRSCVRQGVEDWQPAFETAGFSNAIVARDAPTPAEDPEWDPGDVRHSVVRWAASLTRNAQGPSVSDPRSGEIIESDIVWYHNHMRSYRNRIMLETGASNPLARSLPVDRGLMCEAMRQVIAHEIGHAIGLPHNMISSSAYPTDSLRVKGFAARMGVAPSIMDYARQNYVAQPGDGLEGDEYIRQIGPYDHYAVNWGYRVLPDAPTPEAERPTLNRWIVEHADDPVYRYLPQGGYPDPRAQTEDMGDDPVASSMYGIRNLRAVLPRLVAWTTTDGEDYTELDELYGELQGQWFRYVNHVATLVGGVYVDLKSADQAGAVYEPVPRARQERAMAFLSNEVFDTPDWINDPEVLSRIEVPSGLQRLGRRQVAVVSSLLDPRRLQRLAEAEVSHPALAYPLVDFLDDLKDALWSELAGGAAIDPYRRQLQRGHLERLEYLMTEQPSGNPFQGPAPDLSRSDVRPLVRAQLRQIRTEAERATGRSSDRVTRAHLQDVVERIDDILEGEEGGA